MLSLKLTFRHPLIRFILIILILTGFGVFLRFLYHYIPGGVYYVSHSRVIDTFYRMLMGPVHFLLTITGVVHTINYSQQAAQYYIHLPAANTNLFLWIPCLGISLMYVYTALIIAFQGPLKRKLLFIIFGNLIIQVLNILRLYGLSLLIVQTGTTYTSFTKFPWLVVHHETIFNTLVIFLIFGMFVMFVEKVVTAPCLPAGR